MVPRSRNATTTQTLPRRPEPLWFLRGLLVSGPITALAAASPRRKVTISGRSTSGSYGGREEGPRGRKGSVSPLVLGERGTMISP